MADTPEEKAFETQGRAIDGRIFRIDEEIKQLRAAVTRIPELEAERAALVSQKAVVDPKRPKRAAPISEVLTPRVQL